MGIYQHRETQVGADRVRHPAVNRNLLLALALGATGFVVTNVVRVQATTLTGGVSTNRQLRQYGDPYGVVIDMDHFATIGMYQGPDFENAIASWPKVSREHPRRARALEPVFQLYKQVYAHLKIAEATWLEAQHTRGDAGQQLLKKSSEESAAASKLRIRALDELNRIASNLPLDGGTRRPPDSPPGWMPPAYGQGSGKKPIQGNVNTGVNNGGGGGAPPYQAPGYPNNGGYTGEISGSNGTYRNRPGRGNQNTPPRQNKPPRQNTPPARNKPPLSGNVDQNGQPAKRGTLVGNTQNNGNQPTQSAIDIAWRQWHERFDQALHDKVNQDVSKRGFSQDAFVIVEFTVSKRGYIGGINVSRTNSPVFKNIVENALKSMKGDPVLNFPAGSNRLFMSKSFMFTNVRNGPSFLKPTQSELGDIERR